MPAITARESIPSDWQRTNKRFLLDYGSLSLGSSVRWRSVGD